MSEPVEVVATTGIGRIVGTLWPRASARTLVLIHGLTAERGSWGPLAPALAADHQVVSVDLRGHGDSSWATWEPDGYSARSMAADVAHLCAEAGVRDAVIVGHSLGARVAVALAADARLVSGIVLSDTFPVVGEKGARWANDQIGERLMFPGTRDVDDAEAWLRQRHPEWNEPWARLLASTHFRETWAGRWKFRCDPELIWLLRGRTSRAEGEWVRDRASTVRQPSLLLWGRTSALVEEAEVQASVALMPNAEVETFPTGHYIMREDETGWVDTVRSFSHRVT